MTIFKKEISNTEKFKYSLKDVWELGFIYEYLDNSKTVLPKKSLFILDNNKEMINNVEIIKIDYKLSEIVK